MTQTQPADMAAVAEPTVVLRVEGAAVHFGGIKAVDGIDLELRAGQILGILGPNGSGKSTLLAAMTRLIPLTHGRLILDGSEYQHLSSAKLASRGVTRTFQTVRLLPDLTVLENVQLGSDLHRLPAADRWGPRYWLKRKVADSVDEAIARTGLDNYRGLFPGELSYGVQRRVEIARALATSPRLLLLDEPTAGMNQKERAEVSELLRRLRDEGLTQLLVEHDVQMMVDTSDRLVAMNFGAVIAEGTPTEVVRQPAVREAYLGKRWSEDA